MPYVFKNGQTSVIIRVKLLDSSSTTGAGLTGLTSASAGLIISTIADNEATAVAYTVAGSTIETITTLGTYAAPTATKCRFKEVDATNHKGIYEIQIADARFAVSSAKSLLISWSGATNLQQGDLAVELRSDDPFVAKPANYASFSIDGSGRVDVIKVAGTTQTARDIGASVLLSNGTGTGQIKIASGYVAITWADVAAPTTSLALTGTTIAVTQKVDVDTIKTNPVVNGGTITFPTTATLASTTNITAGTIATVTTVTGLTASDVGAIKAKTDNLPSDPADESLIIAATDALSTILTSTGVKLTAAERNSTADALLNRDMSAVTVTNARSPINALRALRNKVSVPLGIVYAEDDSTTAWQFTTTVDAAQSPITVIDPT